MDPPDKSWEAAQLDARPGVREEVESSDEFRDWRASLPSVVLDDERLYLPWGDVPVDEDQLMYHWARTHGLVDDDP